MPGLTWPGISIEDGLSLARQRGKRVLKSKRLERWWRPAALCVTALLGLAARLYGLDWDQMLSRYQWLAHLYGIGGAQGTNFHPDERQIMYQVVKLSWPASWAQFL